ncbi:hypothetical protein LTR37_013368 [Vermiconidia calcicola]|uniref:Uncharacterized protein n=1 Tax=Vermiconidia calcicola TaxID=1690605 RepID=A0ACC3MY66_9PEZI|nr:hypothetical protein LTR37_013368 [Vermiconidia calcicola]
MPRTHGEWEEEHSLSVAEAIDEAMNTPVTTSGPMPPHHRALPAPHLPLRKSSPKPHALWAPKHQVRGFNPSPAQALPHIDNVTASNEHAFAGRDDTRKRPFKPPLGVQPMGQGEQDISMQNGERSGSNQVGVDNRPPSSPLLPPPPPMSAPPPVGKSKGLRSSKSLGGGLRGWKERHFSAPHKDALPGDRDTVYSVPVERPSFTPAGEVRDSFRSAMTSHSSFVNTSSINTSHSSIAGDSFQSDYVKGFSKWRETEGETESEAEADGILSVEDAIGMYADGFESAKPSMETQGKRSLQASRPTSQPSVAPAPEKAKRPGYAHRRSQSASLLDRVQQYGHSHNLAPPSSAQANHSRTLTKVLAAPTISTARPTSMTAAVPRDRYGFKKVTHYTSVEAYDAWNIQYSQHLERRSKKWHALMKSYGLATDKPFRFPPKSDKIKRYVRKGIPPRFRGAAWFWYAGGPSQLAKDPGLYFRLLESIKGGEALSDNDREHIERDLNRTFPDNVRFKPDATTTLDAQAGAGGGDETGAKKKTIRYSTEPEMPVLQALRRVLQAFAVHNPMIGYCQSLNFIAGLLLLFLDEDEEKAFILLNIVTTKHLPGTHGVALEGANIDIAVLMSCIKDSLPSIWTKIDDKGGSIVSGPAAQALRLPTISLATTAWFMSLFVGTLPIEAVLRVWDCLFFEGSKTLFRIALAIFKYGESSILAVSDPMEIFQVVQTIPRGMLDVNALMEVCFKRRGGFGHVSQELIEERREERRTAVRAGVASVKEDRGWRARLKVRTRVAT